MGRGADERGKLKGRGAGRKRLGLDMVLGRGGWWKQELKMWAVADALAEARL